MLSSVLAFVSFKNSREFISMLNTASHLFKDRVYINNTTDLRKMGLNTASM